MIYRAPTSIKNQGALVLQPYC